MRQLNERHTFTGMQRDIDISKHPANFLYDSRNIRLTPRGEDTLFTVTNEKGTARTNISIKGIYLGHCLLNNYLVIFSKDTSINKDYIYRINLDDDMSDYLDNSGSLKLLYEGNLNFDVTHPIEAIGSYENENVQKVYWTDGLNQPRVINIVGSILVDVDTQFDFIRELQLNEDVVIQKILGASGSFAPGVIQYAFTYFDKYGQESNIFYTSPLLYISHNDRGGAPDEKVDNAFKIYLNNVDHNFRYVRIYSIQRTSINGTPIVRRVQDICIENTEGYNITRNYTTIPYASSEDMPKVFINGRYTYPSIKYDSTIVAGIIAASTNNIRWYGYSKKNYPDLYIKTSNGYVSWSENATDNHMMWISAIKFQGNHTGDTVAYYILETHPPHLYSEEGMVDIRLSDEDFLLEGVSFIDTGLEGDSIDPTELLYKGGESIIAGTLAQKDNTLFLGDITLARPAIDKNTRDSILTDLSITDSTRTFYPLSISKGNYVYDNQLTSYAASSSSVRRSVPCSGFKRGDYYRCGVQFQYKDGKWSNPIYKDDIQVTGKPVSGIDSITVPTLKGTLSAEASQTLRDLGYKRARAVVVFPQLQDRVTICQGVSCPTITKNMGSDPAQYIQSSWFFRPTIDSTINNSPYNLLYWGDTGADGNNVEIQTAYDSNNTIGKLGLNTWNNTLHSPDIEFNDSLHVLEFDNTSLRVAGKASFIKTLSDIDVQTETPTYRDAAGFTRQSKVGNYSSGLLSMYSYEAYEMAFDSDGEVNVGDTNNLRNWMLYPWQRTGSINNDMNRVPSDGIRSSVLKKKVISNLRFSNSILLDDNDVSPITWTYNDEHSTAKLFNSDQLTILKLNNTIYQGNVDTLLTSTAAMGTHYSGNDSPASSNVEKTSVRMKYKSTPHLVFQANVEIQADPTNRSVLPIIEVYRSGDTNNSLYRSTMFGGKSEDALKANSWIPCGEPVILGSGTNGKTVFEYSYGDTYYQRWDCLKTYPFTLEDINQIVEIGSFMLETRVNIDGRYDRNRGQLSNLTMTPANFNLLNPVYSQIDNFFSYRILDEEYYKIDRFPNQITWTKEKQAGADIDLWTNITLGSTYDMDGANGRVVDIKTWNGQLFCFQEKGISNILFNSRVQIPVSDGVPIEISNNYKVDGYKYISDSIGCSNKDLINKTPSGIYFIDSVNSHLYSIGGQLQDVTTTHSMTSWFKTNKTYISKLLYDDVHHDIYIATGNETLCFSEILGQFTSFMDYDNIDLIESYDGKVFTLHLEELYRMFEGEYNDFFPTVEVSEDEIEEPIIIHNYKPWSISFISNGSDNSAQDLDKIFTNIDYRMDMYDSNLILSDKTFSAIKVENEYQDTDDVLLSRLKVNGNPKSYHHKETNLQKKFRTWRIQIPRNKNSLDRIRNQWCKITLKNEWEDNYKAVLHDLNVQYFV